VIEVHVPVYKQLQNLSDHKLTTGKELLRKVYQDKNLIDEFYKTGLDMFDDLSLDRRYSAVIGTDCRHWY
jgi:hypothetical protein